MVIKNQKGMFHVHKNYRDAYVEEAFVEKYIEECLDKYLYIVGDISSGILRLKGFDDDPKSDNYYGFIQDYLDVSCAFGCPFYVLKRIKTEQEYEKLAKDETVFEYNEFTITPLNKQNFDKESLVLKSTPKTKPNIVINSHKINAIPKGELSADLAEYVKQDKESGNKSNNRLAMQSKTEDADATYVSASPDFDPSKSNSNKFNRSNNYKKNNKNHNKNKSFNKNK